MYRLILSILFLIAFVSCASPGVDGTFSIYIAKEADHSKIYSEDEIMRMELEDKPIISTDDIKMYYKDTNRMELTPEALDRIELLGQTYTAPFVVCVGDKHIYAGYFWSHLLAVGYKGIVICPPLAPENSCKSIRIQLGEPMADNYEGDDPRSDPRILRALEKAGKLVERDNVFSIYLPKKIDHSKLYSEDEIMKMELEDKPIIGLDDFFFYRRTKHEMPLTDLAIDRISQLPDRTPFVVCVGYERIYAGYFWSQWQSASNHGIVICKPIIFQDFRQQRSQDCRSLSSQDFKPQSLNDHIIHIQTGYPTSDYYEGNDPRSDPRIINALKRGCILELPDNPET